MPLVRVNRHEESGIDLYDLIEHMPYHLASAVEHIWSVFALGEQSMKFFAPGDRTPYNELHVAQWHVEAEARRREFFELDDEPTPKTDVVWRSFARQVIVADGYDTPLSEFLECLLRGDLTEAGALLESEILELSKTPTTSEGEPTQ